MDSTTAIAVALLLLLLIVYAATARRLEAVHVTGPMLFLVAGILVGPEGFGLLDLSPSTEPVRIVTEITLVLLLFSDAATVDVGALRGEVSGPGRLLIIALPLAILFGTITGSLLFAGISFGVAALIASILSATDLSLGLAMFKNPDVPVRVRRVINVESGLNDGIASPFVTLFIALAISEAATADVPWAIDTVTEVVLGLAIGIVLGGLGGWFIVRAVKRGWSADGPLNYAVLALALLAYGTAIAVHGNPFIAAFVGGLAYRWACKNVALRTAEFTERGGTLLAFAIWVIFGAFVGSHLLESGVVWQPIAYALLSLFVIRMAAVAIALARAGTRWETTAFVGWFGPRGLASVVFLLMAYDALAEANISSDVLIAAAGWTIVLSVFLHGISAQPVARWYGRRAAAFPANARELREMETPDISRREPEWAGRRERWRRAEHSPRSDDALH